MKIREILTLPLVIPDMSATDKEGVLREMSACLCTENSDVTASDELVCKALISRERLGSTGVGESVAIPHAKIAGLRKLVACFGRSPDGIPFDAIDQQPVKLVFVLLVPENSAGVHLKALARISRLLKNPEFREELLGLSGRESLFEAFLREDAKY